VRARYRGYTTGIWLLGKKIELINNINFAPVKISNLKKQILLAVTIIAATSAAAADSIYFKDGMKTVCLEKAWEENGEVKCEYDGVVLTYKKAEVEHIEKRRIRQSTPKPADGAATAKVSITKKPAVSSAAAMQSDGLRFYDPRRTNKYWTSKTGKYKTFQAAVAALGKQYDRPPEWVQSHMGETNDLEEIHRNLASGSVKKQRVPSKPESKNNQAVEFYNPRRTHKYWTGETAKHNTFGEAMLALAKEYDRSPEWVKRHMGGVNDLHAIRQNLVRRKQQEGAQ
jgi:hypothetical protein